MEALLTQPIVSGTYGIVPPHEKPIQPFATGEMIWRTVSKFEAVVLGRATPMITPAALFFSPVHPV